MSIYYTAGNDRDALAELYKLWKGNDIRKSMYITANDHYLAAVDDKTGEYVGALTFIVIYDPVHNRQWGLIENVFIKPEYRRQGIATNLMYHVESMAIGMGCEFMKLTSRKTVAKELYRKLKFEEGSSFYKDVHV